MPYTTGVSGKISLDDLRDSTIYTTISGVPIPMTWLSSLAQLNYPRYPLGFPAVYLDGFTLKTRNTDGSLTSLGTATINFNVISYPTGASDLPLALVGDFVIFMSDLVIRETVIDRA
jgi:hypothetical protein